ncbi:lamin tail domain-containing protein [Nanoarchaeota archaeon]
MKKIVLLALVVLAVSDAASIRINEVMYNPPGDDNNKEYIEVYGTNNLSGFVIGDSSNDSLALLYLGDNGFSLIVEEGFNWNSTNASVYSVGTTIGNNLGNSGDTIYLYYNESVVDSMSYNGSLANDNSRSLEYYNGSFVESIVNGTPGYENSWEWYEFDDILNITLNSSLNITTNITVNATANNSNETIANTCNVSLSLDIKNPKLFYKEGDKIIFRNMLSEPANEYLIEYSIMDLHGNLVRSRETTNTDDKQYTPHGPDQVFVISNRLLSVNCTNIANNSSDSVIVVFKGDELIEESVCEEYIDRIAELEKPSKSSGSGSSCSVVKAASIDSFYTRKKKYSENITLYSKVSGKGIYELKLLSVLEEFTFPLSLNKSKTIEFEVTAMPGRNLFLLELNDNNKTVDVEKLLVFLEGDVKKEMVKEVKPKAQAKKSNETLVVRNHSIPTVTGSVVYDSKEPVSPVAYIIGFLMVASVASASYWKRKSKVKESLKSYLKA